MQILVAATPTVAVASLEAIVSSQHQLIGIITQPDKPAGRGKLLSESPVSAWAKENEFPLFKPETSDEIAKLVSECDVLLTIGYGRILPTQVLQAPKRSCLNLHFSLLPRWRGAAPVQRSIEAGDLVTGVTVFELDPGMDTGPIYCMKRFALDSDITSDELFAELAPLGAEAVLETLQMIENGEKPTPQSSDGSSLAAKITPQSAEIDWKMSAIEISQAVRAFTSQPGAWTTFRGSRIKLDTPHSSDVELAPGSLLVRNRELLVGTSSTAIAFEFITPEGKARLLTSAWLNGARISEGDHFG